MEYHSVILRNDHRGGGGNEMEESTNTFPPSSTTDKIFTSPLEKTLSDLRHKYIAAAGPTINGGISHYGSTNPPLLAGYSNQHRYEEMDDDDEDNYDYCLYFDDTTTTTTDQNNTNNVNIDNSNHRRNLILTRSKHGLQSSMTTGYSRCISTVDLSSAVGPGNRKASMDSTILEQQAAADTATTTPKMKNKKSSTTSAKNNEAKMFSNEIATGGTGTQRRSRRRQQRNSLILPKATLEQQKQEEKQEEEDNKKGLASKSHARNLLACTPHLRCFSEASVKMQCTGTMYYKTSSNPIIKLLNQFHHYSMVGMDTSSSSPSNNNVMNNAYTASMADYESCIIRDRTNMIVAKELASFVRNISYEMSTEEFTEVEDEIFELVLTLLHSEACSQRLAGVAAMDALIDAPSEDEEKKYTKFVSNLTLAMEARNVDFAYLSGLTRALGKIFLASTNADFVEEEVPVVMEWLKNERSDRRLAAVLRIKELAKNAPTNFYAKINQNLVNNDGINKFLSRLLPVLKDEQPIVRACGADALAACLKIIVDPARRHHCATENCFQIYEFIEQGLNVNGKGKIIVHSSPKLLQSKIEIAQHSALLIIGDMLDYANSFMLPRFEDICKSVLELRNHPKDVMKLEVVRLLPRLANGCPGSFTRRYLETSLEFIMDCASMEPDIRAGVDLRPTAYFALGQLVLAVTNASGQKGGSIPLTTLQIIPHHEESKDVYHHEAEGDGLETRSTRYYMKKGDIYENIGKMFELVRDGLKTVRSESIHCGADLVQALGSHAKPYVPALLDGMFQSGISEDLICSLHAIAHFLPSETGHIGNRLLEELSLNLAGTRKVKQLCDPQHASPQSLDEASRDNYIVVKPDDSPPSITINMSEENEVIVKLIVSLRTLRTLLNMDGGLISSQSAIKWTLLPFIRDVVTCYLVHPSYDIRREAGQTCCSILIPYVYDDESTHNMYSYKNTMTLGTASLSLVEEVLEKLLIVAVSDSSSVVRISILRALDTRYDQYLCRYKHLSTLLLCLQDDSLSVRVATLKLIGRLAELNPAQILPELRQVLVDNVIELRYNNDTGRKEAITRFLIVFFKTESLHRLVHPLLHSIMNGLPLISTTPRLSSLALEALGELSQVVKEEIKPWLHALLPLVMESMIDQSSANRQRTSMKTLGQIADNTNYVIDPFIEYPELLSRAVAVLPATKKAPWRLRKEVIRMLGILGALDPDRYPVTTGSKVRVGGGIGSGYFIEVDKDKNTDPSTKRSKSFSENQRRKDESSIQRSSTIVSSQESRPAATSTDDDDAPAHVYMYELYSKNAMPLSKILPAKRLTPMDNNFHPTVALQALTSILTDPSLAVYHEMVMKAVMFILNSLGVRCVPFLKGIVPHIIHTTRSCGQAFLRETLFKQIATLSSIVKENLKAYVPDIFELIKEFWDSKHLATVLALVEKLAAAVPAEFKKYVPDLISRFLVSIDDFVAGTWLKNSSTPLSQALKRLALMTKSIRTLIVTLGDYLHMLLPALLKLTDSLISPSIKYERSSNLSRQHRGVDTLQTVAALLQIGDKNDLMGSGSKKMTGIGTSTKHFRPTLAAGSAQTIMRILSKTPGTSKDIGYELINTLCVCACTIGKEQWMLLYNERALEVIILWYNRANLNVNHYMTLEHETFREELSQSLGLERYCLLLSQPSFEQSLEMLADPSAIASSTAIIGEENRANMIAGEVRRSDPDMFRSSSSTHAIHNQSNRHIVNQVKLQRAWNISQSATREECDEWMRRFSLALLRESPAPALRACYELANAYQPLARELFRAAFDNCWTELTDECRKSLINALKIVFKKADPSPEILQTLLNLAEFAERDGIKGGLPIEIDILANLALNCQAYAKALHYKELEHLRPGGSACIEDLISINKKLDLPEAAMGVLKAAQFEMERHGVSFWTDSDASDSRDRYELSSRIFHRHDGEAQLYSIIESSDYITGLEGVDMQASWLAKLGSWADALSMYEYRLKEHPEDIEAILGCMKCFEARGEWKDILNLTFPEDQATKGQLRKASRFCAQAAWRLDQWDDLEFYSAQLIDAQHLPSAAIDIQSVDYYGAFYSAIFKIHRKEWKKAAVYIDGARRAMDSRFTALMAESHKRAYSSMVQAQVLAEMEEIIKFKKLEERAEHSSSKYGMSRDSVQRDRQQLLSLWRKRLAGCRVDAEVHSLIHAVRSMVLEPTEEVDATLTLSALLRQGQFYKFSEMVLTEPLVEQLKVTLDSPVFGFDAPGHLGLQTVNPRNMYLANSDDLVYQIMNSNDSSDFFPSYGSLHKQYSNELVHIAGGLEKIQVEHKLYYAYVKYMRRVHNSDDAINSLSKLANIIELIAHFNKSYDPELRVKCWAKLGEWKFAQSPPGKSLMGTEMHEILGAFKRCTVYDRHGYRSWHNWAMVNFRLAQQYDDTKENVLYAYKLSHKSKLPSNFSAVLQNHIKTAIHAFIKAIALGTKRWSALVQQDLLNFLSCLFRYGESKDVASVIKEEIGTVPLDAWMGVLPQLLARFQIKSPTVREILHRLLEQVGQKHPQALLYPLAVMVQSPADERKVAADTLLDSLKRHSPDLVQHVLMVSSELVNVAILAIEEWFEALEDASKFAFVDNDFPHMIETLVPLHKTMETGPLNETDRQFFNGHGKNLAKAYSYLKEYIKLSSKADIENNKYAPFHPSDPGRRNDTAADAARNLAAMKDAAMNNAWDIYYTAFRKINGQLPTIASIPLEQCSTALFRARDLEIAVPGSYRVDGSYVKIKKFHSNVQILPSKQRPRKMIIQGVDGKDYMIVLKGHEDLRQDERVMQLFGSINALMARDRRTNNHDLNIQRYNITPLAFKAGVVGWVPNSDTLHTLLRDYRLAKNIALNAECKNWDAILTNGPKDENNNYWQIPTITQKLELFTDALETTVGNGNDLHDIFWAKSTNSEEWLDRRTKFTRSLAVMSMVGYVLGLGDRHPSNLMIDQKSGRVLHIDFGDCFEVAMERDKFPERVPFRLTRMLIKAMEVSGVEGNFRNTCERTMLVLRDNMDSLITMLEAFVYDPLISWRLLNTNNEKHEQGSLPPMPSSTTVEDSITKTPMINEETIYEENVMSSYQHDPEKERMQQQRKANLQKYKEMQNMISNSGSSGTGSIIDGNSLSYRMKKSIKRSEVMSLLANDAKGGEFMNERAIHVIKRVQDKLSGNDFQSDPLQYFHDDGVSNELDVKDQVQRLIVQATNTENLVQLYSGWCAFW